MKLVAQVSSSQRRTWLPTWVGGWVGGWVGWMSYCLCVGKKKGGGEEGSKSPTHPPTHPPTSSASMILAAWEVDPLASAVQKLSVGLPKGRLSMKGVMLTYRERGGWVGG